MFLSTLGTRVSLLGAGLSLLQRYLTLKKRASRFEGEAKDRVPFDVRFRRPIWLAEALGEAKVGGR